MFLNKIILYDKFWLIISYAFSALLLVGCFISYYKSNIFSFFFSVTIPILFIINIFIVFYWLLKRKKHIYISLLSVCIHFVFFTTPLQLNGKSEILDDEDVFSFMTFNARDFGVLNNIRNIERTKKIIDFIENKNPDITCFQEFSKFEFQSFSYYPHTFVGYRPNFEKTLQVIYSKYPIINKGFVDFPDTRNQTIYADININGSIVRVYNIHLQSYRLRFVKSILTFDGAEIIINKIAEAQKKQEVQVEIILKHASDFKGKIIFCGDFNSTNYTENYKKLSQNKKDTFVSAGFGFGITYYLLKYPLRLDYILIDKEIDVLSHENFNVSISDHEPVLAKLKF
ncbi:Uncharacterized conserved protein YafD, endonuclease/exonuclease/phosphatase (EEP) superfamily [Hyunsoonleella jejuensis]|uniref:Uncharacterized conserved protein YafD, endonuclease/exonuclease/phosphatase (EEP) superfamily n=1 Tax=Hyunsoonleella jejuensis TaxID=419940 RepID=A0A1H9JDN7_9FLAO|nr:endonuclease/exonuclease/phosphatase family protein [Hyunsoonleella jejuensis]SEQ85034.1 Uncharacterized conserved protein YafD, endonuclease/exonuclease/phosphatase (EEP) superfamily [Hyunsoonleella jejuensis]